MNGNQNLFNILAESSGLPRERWPVYRRKLDFIAARIKKRIKPYTKKIEVAKQAHQFLFESKPWRYTKKDRTIDAIIDSEYSLNSHKKVGHCISFVAEYNLLLEKFGIPSKVGIEFGYSQTSHVVSLLENKGRQIIVELTNKDGFDYPEKEYASLVVKPNTVLGLYFYSIQGHLLSYDKNEREAIPFYKKAWKFDKKHPDPPFNIGDSLILLKEYDAAIPYLEKALKLQQDYYAHYNLGKAHGMLGNCKMAKKYFKICNEMRPKYLMPKKYLMRLEKFGSLQGSSPA